MLLGCATAAALFAACGLDTEGAGTENPDGGAGAGSGGGAIGNECFINSKACPNDKGELVCTPTNDPSKGCNTSSCEACDLPNATASCDDNGCRIDQCDDGWKDCDTNPATGCEKNFNFDPTNCGTCGNNCYTTKGPNFTCDMGQCVVTDCVPPTTADCDGDKTNGCEVDTLTDVDNCGFCTNKCNLANANPSCVAKSQGAVQVGACAIDSCTGSYADCDKLPENGCEINTATDPNNCGTCSKTCSSVNGVAGCLFGNCAIACLPGFGDCNNDASDGCERNLNTDPNHCGGCGKKCNPQNVTAAKCSNGGCDYVACLPGFGDCDGNKANGCETNTNQNINHCGTCGKKCTAASGGTAVCSTGSCGTSCSPPTSLCQAAGVCANLNNDVNHCGTCDNQCTTNEANATPACNSTNCGFNCNSGYTQCGSPPNSCVDTDTSVAHCGGCNQPCAQPPNSTRFCSGGACGFNCNSPYSKCGTQCKNLNTDITNCLTCGNVCSPPPGGTAVCTGTGCDFTCGSLTKCGAACVNTTNDPLNCNTCGNNCGANRICQSSACVCAPGYKQCGGACVDTSKDNAHCGDCDQPCAGETTCQSSVCKCPGTETECPTGSGNCVDTQSDPQHCGSCTISCDAGTCVNGICSGINDGGGPG